MALVPWKPKNSDPFKDLLDLNDRFFGLTMFPNLNRFPESIKEGWNPSLDVEETGEAFLVKADLPGLTQKDIHVSLEDDILTIKGERKNEAEKESRNSFIAERSYGYFERSLRLGVKVDSAKVKAAYKNGVLELTLPKSEQAKPRQIDIEVN